MFQLLSAERTLAQVPVACTGGLEAAQEGWQQPPLSLDGLCRVKTFVHARSVHGTAMTLSSGNTARDQNENGSGLAGIYY